MNHTSVLTHAWIRRYLHESWDSELMLKLVKTFGVGGCTHVTCEKNLNLGGRAEGETFCTDLDLPIIRILKFWHWVPQNVIVFWDRAFKVVMKFKWACWTVLNFNWTAVLTGISRNLDTLKDTKDGYTQATGRWLYTKEPQGKKQINTDLPRIWSWALSPQTVRK